MAVGKEPEEDRQRLPVPFIGLEEGSTQQGLLAFHVVKLHILNAFCGIHAL